MQDRLVGSALASGEPDRSGSPSPVAGLARELGSYLWQTIRLPALLLLVALEPLVAFCLGALTILGVLVSIFLELSGASHFPLIPMLALSFGWVLLLVAYQGLIRLLSR